MNESIHWTVFEMLNDFKQKIDRLLRHEDTIDICYELRS